jgi:hypothetical protein
VHRIVARQVPSNGPPLLPVDKPRELDAFLSQPYRDLANAADLVELTKDQIDCPSNPAIRVHLQPIAGGSHIAQRNASVQIATASLESQSFLRSLTEDGEFKLAERTLHPQQ